MCRVGLGVGCTAHTHTHTTAEHIVHSGLSVAYIVIQENLKIKEIDRTVTVFGNQR